jgi:predicted nucleotidyltransferase
MDILNISDKNQKEAWQILEETGIVKSWENIGATVNIVGSLKTGLIMKSKDIDMHVYTDKLNPSESFSVIEELNNRLNLRELHYINSIDTEEECIEWHLRYKDWKFDIIHLRRGSKYDGTVERMTDAIIRKLTPEIRRTILKIKNDTPTGTVIPSVEIYRAVFTGKIKDYSELEQWRKDNMTKNSLDWLP